jgi:phage-related baseplate assembly protein
MMASRFNKIDLSLLPPPEIIETLEFEVIFQRKLEEFRARYPVEEIESDPIIALLQHSAYQEMIFRAKINDDLKGVFLATSWGSNLDNLAAFYGAHRFVLVEADPDAFPPVEEVLESDNAFRARVQLAIEAQSTAGPRGAYLYWARSSDPRVFDAAVDSTTPGQVDVFLLSPDGSPVAELPSIVLAALSDEDVRPLTDTVVVANAKVTVYSVNANITFLPGPDRSIVMQAAQSAAQAYVDDQFQLGRDITRSGLFAALHRPGVQNVKLLEPPADIVVPWNEAAKCGQIILTDAGTDV